MPTYRVYLAQTVSESCTITIEADNEEKAEELALEQSLNATWRFDEVEQEPEVIACEKVDE